MMLKRIAILLFVFFLVGAIWYLGLRSYDLKVSFRAQALPGIVEQTVKRWAFIQKAAETNQIERFHFSQVIEEHQIEWEIQYINDSLSHVDAYVNFRGTKLLNRIYLLIPGSNLKDEGYQIIKEVHDLVQNHLTRIKVGIDGRSEIPSKFCVCTVERTTQLLKAQGMMRNYGMISSFILSNGLKTDGVPLIEITKWDQETDSLHFNFCFPIIVQTELPENDLLFYHSIKTKNAIKATYNGNYITSDRAWYVLLNYANSRNFEVTEKPIEFFYSNPSIGENELRWKAEIFLPLK